MSTVKVSQEIDVMDVRKLPEISLVKLPPGEYGLEECEQFKGKYKEPMLSISEGEHTGKGCSQSSWSVTDGVEMTL